MLKSGLLAACLCLGLRAVSSLLDAAPYLTGDVIALECQGDVAGARWLEARPGEKSVVLATEPRQTLSRWRVHVIDDTHITLRSATERVAAYLDGDTVRGRVSLAPDDSALFSGTRWRIIERGNSIVSLECAGDRPGPRLLDGRTQQQDAILTDVAANSGTRWRVHLLSTTDDADPIDAPSAPASTGRRHLVAKLPAAQLDGVVLVEGERSVGTGFFARIRGQAFVVTNQHVLANNPRIRLSNRTGIRPAITGYVFAKDRDLALLRIDADPATLPLLKIADSAASAAVGEELLIAGNSEGGGTVLQSEGRVVGFGFDRVEHDIATVSGNSGSPVFRQSTWEIIAIDTWSRTRRASRVTDPASRNAPGTSLADIRHFGVRIDSAKEWTTIDWDAWQKECAQLTALERRIEGLEKLLTEKRATWITYPDIAARVQSFEERSRDMAGQSAGFRREAAALFQNLLAYAQAQERAATQLKERNIGHVREQAEALAGYATQIETALRGWDVNVADRLKATAR